MINLDLDAVASPRTSTSRSRWWTGGSVAVDDDTNGSSLCHEAFGTASKKGIGSFVPLQGWRG
jgi:hypothetical protein